MERRAFVAGSLTLLAAPAAVEAQPAGKVPHIGVMSSGSATSPDLADALRRGLTELGWAEGQNILIEWRWAEGRPERYPALIAELVRLKVDLIVAGGGTPGGTGRQARHEYDSHRRARRGRSRRFRSDLEPGPAGWERHRAVHAEHGDQR